MMAFAPSLLPLDPASSASEQLAILSQLKNHLIGHTQRKRDIIAQPGAVDCLVQIISARPTGSRLAPDLVELQLQAGAILGAISVATIPSAFVLASAHAHAALISAFIRCVDSVGRPVDPSVARLAEVLLRAIKTLHSDLAAVTLNSPSPSISLSCTSASSLKGKSKAPAGPDPGLADPASHLTGPATAALAALFAPSSAGGSGFVERMIHIVSSDAVDGYSLRMVESGCLLLAGAVASPGQRDVLAREHGLVAGLMDWAERGMGKIQIGALEALSAILNDAAPAAQVLLDLEARMPRFLDVLADFAQSGRPELVLAAATCRVVIFRVYRPGSRPPGPGSTKACPELDAVRPLVPALLALIQREPAHQAEAASALALLVSSEPSLQEVAVARHAFPALQRALSAPVLPGQPYATPAALAGAWRAAEALLGLVGALLANDEGHRQHAVAAGLVGALLAALAHASADVRASGARALRGLSRSPHILRTGMLGEAVGEKVMGLIAEGQEERVVEAGLGLVSNLVLEFSPVQGELVRLGVVERLSELVRVGGRGVRVEALFALKNAAYHSKGRLKQQIAIAVGWTTLGDLIGSPDSQVAEQALALLRNVVCTYDEDAEPAFGLAGVGEDRLLSILTARLVDDKDEAMLQNGLFTLVNLATEGELTRLAIAARDDLLQATMYHLTHPSPHLRSAAVQVFTNLSATAPGRRRAPKEIREKLKVAGVTERLRGMGMDSDLNVREKVRDYFEAVEVVGF